MKTSRYFFFLAFMFFSLSMSAQKKGDVNRDDIADISDVVAVINTIAGSTTYKTTADVNGDNTIDISDIVAVINIIASGGGDINDNAIRLSDLTKIIFNGTDISVLNGNLGKTYPTSGGLELNLIKPGTNAGLKFLDIYMNGEIVASITFTDADRLEFTEDGIMQFALNGEIVQQSLMTSVDSILVYDPSKEPLTYLGIIGFNQELYEKAIGVLDKKTVYNYKSFISSLTAKYGTILYYAADNALDRLADFHPGTPLKSVNLITFTDGLDQGSHILNDTYETDENYLSHLSTRISKTKIAGLPLTSYSIGLRGSDVTGYNSLFQTNLQSLASKDENTFVVNSMRDVNTQLGSIANEIISTITTTTQKVTFTIPGTGKGTKVRIVLDGKTADSSSAYIEGTYQTSDKSLHDVTLKGITAGGLSSLVILSGSVNGIFVTFSLDNIIANFIISQSNIRQYNMTGSSSSWQINSEFNPSLDAQTETKTTYSGTAVFLLLDCSSSMSSDFSNMKNYANNFISQIADNSNTVTLKRPFGLTTLVCPDHNHPHVIDMGVAGKWACCNVGASAPWEYGDHYAWGETKEKTTYNWSTYIHCDGSSDTFHDLGSDIAGTQYDVAHEKWGGSWRMPSHDQNHLLRENCSTEWTLLNGVKGLKITASNGNSIFLPAAGSHEIYGIFDVSDIGAYWSSTSSPEEPGCAYSLCFNDEGQVVWSYWSRHAGLSVRPVTE